MDTLKVLSRDSRDRLRVKPNWERDPRVFLVQSVDDGKVESTFAPAGMIDLIGSEQYPKDEER